MNAIQSLISAVMNAAAARLKPGAPPAAADPRLSTLPAFLGQHTNPARNAQRQDLRAVGKRQYKRYLRAGRASTKET